MKVLRATEFGFILSLIVVLVLGLGFAQTIPATPFAATSVIALPHSIGNTQPTRAFPRLNLWDGEVLTYLGMFSPDAVFHTTSKLTSTTGYSPGEGIPPADFRCLLDRQQDRGLNQPLTHGLNFIWQHSRKHLLERLGVADCGGVAHG